jgi:hypothetical protein
MAVTEIRLAVMTTRPWLLHAIERSAPKNSPLKFGWFSNESNSSITSTSQWFALASSSNTRLT